MWVNIPDDWLPLAININALPHPLRRLIHDLETQADPADMVAENQLLRDQVAQLEAKTVELAKLNNAAPQMWELVQLICDAPDQDGSDHEEAVVAIFQAMHGDACPPFNGSLWDFGDACRAAGLLEPLE